MNSRTCKIIICFLFCDKIIQVQFLCFLLFVSIIVVIISDNSVDEETKQDFLTCLSAMKLLSKFLGFVNFLPYYSSIPYSEKIILEHCSIRNQVCIL